MPTKPGATRAAARQIIAGGLALIFLAARVAAVEPSAPRNLYVSVERDGRPVEGLNPTSFRLLIDGGPAPVQLAPQEQPAQVVFVIENSRSADWYRSEIAAAMQEFAETAPEGNWYALVGFARDVEVTADFTRVKENIASAFDSMGQSGWEDISTFDAVYAVLGRLRRIPGRHVVVLIGSGLDRYSERSLGDAQKELEASDVTVYAIGTGALLRRQYEPYVFPGLRMNEMQAQGVLETLAEDSGGKAWFPDSESGFADAMRGVFTDMASQYRLVYAGGIPPDGKLHKIKLKIVEFGGRELDYDVRVRKGWRAG
ncbi:MAG: VWA domain-containing protein [Rhodospirillales bacterium]